MLHFRFISVTTSSSLSSGVCTIVTFMTIVYTCYWPESVMIVPIADHKYWPKMALDDVGECGLSCLDFSCEVDCNSVRHSKTT